MITKKQQKWLASLPTGPDGKIDKSGTDPVKYFIYMGRIQNRIEKELEALLWLSYNHPEIFLDEEREIPDSNGKIIPHRRWRKMFLIMTNLNPRMAIEFVKEHEESDSAT